MTERPSDEHDPKRLQALEKRLAELRKEEAPKPAADDNFRMADMAWRMVIELVSGLGIGFGIGYGLDVLIGTKPWLMLLFTLLGLAAGVRVMMRSAADMAKTQAALAANSTQAAATAAGEEGR